MNRNPNRRNLQNCNIVVDGNSISAWTDGTAAGKWSDRLKLLSPFINPGCTITNVAIPGRATGILVAEAASKVDILFAPSRLNICILWEGTNDVSFTARNPVAMRDNVANYCLDRRRAGWKTVCFGLQGARVASGGATSQAEYDVVRPAYNMLMRDTWRNFADAYVDPSTSTKLNNALAADVPDGVHPSSLTLNDILPLVSAALQSIDLRSLP
jgi:lysophospholipase L1-like esterase